MPIPAGPHMGSIMPIKPASEKGAGTAAMLVVVFAAKSCTSNEYFKPGSVASTQANLVPSGDHDGFERRRAFCQPVVAGSPDILAGWSATLTASPVARFQTQILDGAVPNSAFLSAI